LSTGICNFFQPCRGWNLRAIGVFLETLLMNSTGSTLAASQAAPHSSKWKAGLRQASFGFARIKSGIFLKFFVRIHACTPDSRGANARESCLCRGMTNTANNMAIDGQGFFGLSQLLA
jgi:hypothetical protein